MKFNWPELLRAGVLHLRLSPEAFWALTPAELRLLMGDRGRASLDRSGLDALLAQFPDSGEGDRDDR